MIGDSGGVAGRIDVWCSAAAIDSSDKNSTEAALEATRIIGPATSTVSDVKIYNASIQIAH
jgi:hypothetical protein